MRWFLWSALLVGFAGAQAAAQNPRNNFPNRGILPAGGPTIAAQGPNRTNAPQLMEALRRTVSPNSWDVNGGQGAMYYYSQNHALIIRQSQEVHEQIQDVLRQLRRE